MVLNLVLIGLAITLDPLPLTAFIVVLPSKRGVRKGAAFVFGWLLSLAVVVTVTVLATGNDPPKPSTAPSLAALAAKVERLGRTGIRPELARAHLLYGEWLRRVNRRADARSELTRAHKMFTAMGMDGFAERTGRELLATGTTVGRRAAETHDQLTAQEAQIARLARDGLSNQEIGAQLFLSTRTVEWHLRKVFTKLGVSSRGHLQQALADRGRPVATA